MNLPLNGMKLIPIGRTLKQTQIYKYIWDN